MSVSINSIIKRVKRLECLFNKNIKPYKEVVLLYTGNLDEVSQQYLKSGTLEIGLTYEILLDSTVNNHDFTNVGAPNNNLGTTFIATGTTPNSWGDNVDDVDILSTYVTGIPKIKILYNDLGQIWMSPLTTGAFQINSNNLFTTDKTIISSSTSGDDGTINGSTVVVLNSENVIDFYCLGFSGGPITTIGGIDNFSFLNYINIKVYQ